MAFNVFFLLYFGLRVSSVALVARGREGIQLVYMVVEIEIVFSLKETQLISSLEQKIWALFWNF